jgi:hypothetical protein
MFYGFAEAADWRPLQERHNTKKDPQGPAGVERREAIGRFSRVQQNARNQETGEHKKQVQSGPPLK